MRHRRADPVWVLLLALSAGLSLLEAVRPTSGGWLPLLMIGAAYPAGRRIASLRLATCVFAVVAGCGLALAVRHSPDPLPLWRDLVLLEFLASVLPWWVGRYRRLRAEQRARERDIVAEQARLRERARIAQDMHDSLGHELALVALHGGALELSDGLTDTQRRAVGELRAGAVRATNRLHEIVRVLGAADATADLQPVDESIEDLVARAAAAGLRVRLHQDASGPAWSLMTSQAAHRVVQESLTNATRHAPGARVSVAVSRQDASTRIDVVNDAAVDDTAGPPSRGTGTGQGLIGLDERVRLVGGRLSVGQPPGGGWTVTAVLPDDAGPWRGEDDPPGFEITLDKRLSRRRQLQTALLPLGVGLALTAALVAVQMLTAARTGLPDDRYDGLRVGQPRAQIEPLLPPQDVRDVPPVLAAPPRLAAPPGPPGSSCVFYQTGGSALGLDPYLYRLCFRDGVLVAKDRVEKA